MRRRRALHIINIPWYSGLAAYAADMAGYGLMTGWDSTLAVVGDSILYHKLKDRFDVLGLPGRGPADTLRGLMKMALSDISCDCIICHTGSSLFMGIFLGLFRSVPVYRVRAESGRVSHNILNRIIHVRTGKIVVPTRAIAENFRGMNVPDEKIYFLPPLAEKRELPVEPDPAGRLRAGILGRLDPVKGHHAALDSFNLLSQDFPEAELVLAGPEEGVRWEELYRYALERGLRDRVKYLGYLSGDGVAQMMSGCQIGVVPSLGSEAVSRAALEWMAAGRPVIASRVGGLPEIIKEGYNGFLVEPGDTGTMADRLKLLFSDSRLRKEMGANAMRYIEENHAPDVYVEHLKKVMEI